MAEPFLGEIRLMSFAFAPKGWALCNGQLLPINQNQALFALLGATYGGDGRVRAYREVRAHGHRRRVGPDEQGHAQPADRGEDSGEGDEGRAVFLFPAGERPGGKGAERRHRGADR